MTDEYSTELKGHTGRVFSIALASLSDGSRIAASASHDRTVRIWSLDTLELIRTLHYKDFVWRVFIALTPTPCVIAFISAEDRIQVNHIETGEMIHEFYGRLLFAGNVPIFKQPVIVTGIGAECDDICFTDVYSGQTLCMVLGGFDRVFRAVVTNGAQEQYNTGDTSLIGPSPPMLVFTTWNSQNRCSTIQTYELTSALTEGCYDTDGTLGSEVAKEVARYPVDKTLMRKLFEGDSRLV
jgi:WD40 repeat protein